MANLIDKDALVAEIERRIKTNKECMLGLRNLDYYQGEVDALNDTISSLDTLEVKDFWKPADGDDLPEYDREVIALLDNGKVVFAHRPPEFWDGKNIDTGKVTRYYPKTYDKGGWNIPNAKYWLDVDLPK